MDRLKAAFKKGEISLEQLFKMTDTERHAILESYLGNEKFASFLNAEFEKAMISTQKKAFANFVNKTFGEKKIDIRTAVMKKVDKLDRVLSSSEADDFLNDLVDQRLGFKVTEEEVGHLVDLKKDVDAKKIEIDRDSPRNSPSRVEYGNALVRFQEYVGKLKSEGTDISLGELAKHKLLHPKELVGDINDITISLLASFDNSLWGRQGIKELFSPFSGGTARWATNFAKSLKDIGKQVFAKNTEKGLFANQSDAILNAIKADVYSRENALNGNYKAAKNGYGLGVDTEEYFPTSLPERIPLLGRLFKASEVAFNGGALRMRADIADALIKSAQENGIDVKNKIEADALGKLTGDLTGRGEIGKAAVINKTLKLALFSIRFLKSNIDFLLAPAKYGAELLRGSEEGLFAKKQAALRTLQVVGSIAGLIMLSNALKPGSAETDPRSSNFGKIKVNGKTYDISGGMGSLVTLASRIIPTEHNEKFGFWYKSPTTGQLTQLSTGKYGTNSALDMFNSFMEGKAAPLAGTVRDILEGQDYQGRKPTPGTVAGNLVTPISIQTFEQLKDPASADGLLAILSDALGFGVQTQKVYKKKK